MQLYRQTKLNSYIVVATIIAEYVLFVYLEVYAETELCVWKRSCFKHIFNVNRSRIKKKRERERENQKRLSIANVIMYKAVLREA